MRDVGPSWSICLHKADWSIGQNKMTDARFVFRTLGSQSQPCLVSRVGVETDIRGGRLTPAQTARQPLKTRGWDWIVCLNRWTSCSAIKRSELCPNVDSCIYQLDCAESGSFCSAPGSGSNHYHGFLTERAQVRLLTRSDSLSSRFTSMGATSFMKTITWKVKATFSMISFSYNNSTRGSERVGRLIRF